MNQGLKTALVWVALILLALVALVLAGTGDGGRGAPDPASYEDDDYGYDYVVSPERQALADGATVVGLARVEEAIAEGSVQSLVFDEVGGVYARTTAPPWLKLDGGWSSAAAQRLMTHALAYEQLGEVHYDEAAMARAAGGGLLSTVSTLLFPLLLLIGVLLVVVLLIKRRNKNMGGVLNLRKSPARELEQASHLTFSDVGGLVEVKDRLQDVIDLLRAPDRWARAGVRPPKGVLLEGPPGCGKTLLARAVAGEAKVPVFVISATDLVEMFVGVGAARVRDTFEKARAQAPAVLFIDELDAIGRRRGTGMVGTAHDEREQTLNQLLVSLDGAEQHTGSAATLVVMAATNRADILDPALLRPGRFDLRLTVPPPDAAGRRSVLDVHTRRLRVDPDVNLDRVAAKGDGLTGAELELAVNEAAIRAARRDIRGEGTPLVTPDDLERGLEAARRAVPDFDAVDALMVESNSQLSRPRGAMRVKLHLEGGAPFEGRLLWADPLWLKVAPDAGPEQLIPKRRLLAVEALAGTDAVDPATLPPPPSPVGAA